MGGQARSGNHVMWGCSRGGRRREEQGGGGRSREEEGGAERSRRAPDRGRDVGTHRHLVSNASRDPNESWTRGDIVHGDRVSTTAITDTVRSALGPRAVAVIV